VTLALPHLQALAAGASAYVQDANGWFVLSARGRYAAQAASRSSSSRPSRC